MHAWNNSSRIKELFGKDFSKKKSRTQVSSSHERTLISLHTLVLLSDTFVVVLLSSFSNHSEHTFLQIFYSCFFFDACLTSRDLMMMLQIKRWGRKSPSRGFPDTFFFFETHTERKASKRYAGKSNVRHEEENICMSCFHASRMKHSFPNLMFAKTVQSPEVESL